MSRQFSFLKADKLPPGQDGCKIRCLRYLEQNISEKYQRKFLNIKSPQDCGGADDDDWGVRPPFPPDVYMCESSGLETQVKTEAHWSGKGGGGCVRDVMSAHSAIHYTLYTGTWVHAQVTACTGSRSQIESFA